MSGPTYRKSHKIETPRLIIRNAVAKDAPAIAALRGNPINNEFEGVDSGDPEVYLKRMVNWQKASEEGRYAFTVFALRPADGESDEGEVIGFGGFNEFRWIDPPAAAADSTGAQAAADQKKVLEVDVGAQIDHKYWRKGYGREAFIGMAEYAFKDLGAEQLSCDTGRLNEPFRRLMKTVELEKREVAHVNPPEHPGAGEEAWLWQFTRVDWENSTAAMKKSGTWPL